MDLGLHGELDLRETGVMKETIEARPMSASPPRERW
jgi:hypothetical protein